MKVCFLTLGCAKNEVDSNRMRALALNAGYIETDEPSKADAIIVNTCAFIAEATIEAVELIVDMGELDCVRSGKTKLIVAGCMPARYGADANNDLAKSLPEVDIFVPVADEEQIVSVLDNVLKNTNAWAPATKAVSSRTRIAEEAWAYVKIADGCSRKCSFCTIPYIRGPYKSRSVAAIIAETDELVEQGVREIILIAQDTSIWNGGSINETDRVDSNDTHPADLADLLKLLALRYPDVWLRVMYLQPQGVNQKLLTTMANHANICNYLDIPLQHADASILSEMGRRGSAKEYLDMLAKIRQVLPDVSLRTTVMAGFPGESRTQAKANERFLEDANFNYVGVFAYSQEDGTVAGRRSDQVPRRTRLARAQRLRDIADRSGYAAGSAIIGMTIDVLVCGSDEEGIFGRSQAMAPDVDGIVHLKFANQSDQKASGEFCQKGKIVKVLITDAVLYDLYGEVR